MPSFWYNLGATEVLQGSIRLGFDTIKVMLLGNKFFTYVPDKDHTVIDPGIANATSPKACEADATGYVKAFGGAGRKVIVPTFSADNINDRGVIVFPDPTWNAIGNPLGDTITHALLVKEITNDTLSRLIACWDIVDTMVNGGNFILDMNDLAGGGNLRGVAT